MDFYSDMDISNAKSRLLHDLSLLKMSEKIPHIPARREGDGRVIREVEDMFSVFTFLDEKKLLDQLPKYVADGPDSMPSTRLYEGDLKVFMDHLARMDEKMTALSTTMATIVHDVRALQFKPSTAYSQAVSQSTPVQGARNTRSASPASAMIAGISSFDSLGNSETRSQQPAGVNINNTESNTKRSSVSTTNWASLAMNDPYSVLVSDDQQQSDDVASSVGQPFVPYETRRTRQKRRRQESQQQQQQQSAANRSGQSSLPTRNDARPRRGPLMIGKSSGSTTNAAISAANSWYRKSVFYIDNVDNSVTVDDLAEFVASLSVRVVKCNEVRPRQRRNDTGTVNGKAFRLCINRDDRSLLRDADKWPAYVGISDWIFKPTNTGGNTNDNRSRAVDEAARVNGAAGAVLRRNVQSDEISAADAAECFGK